jgi:hypothetical protein
MAFPQPFVVKKVAPKSKGQAANYLDPMVYSP